MLFCRAVDETSVHIGEVLPGGLDLVNHLALLVLKVWDEGGLDGLDRALTPSTAWYFEVKLAVKGLHLGLSHATRLVLGQVELAMGLVDVWQLEVVEA